MQLDYDLHPFARAGAWDDPWANTLEACRVVGEARALLRRRSVLGSEALLRAALAAFDCGTGDVLRALRHGRDIDFYSAGRDYGRDVLARAAFFRMQGWD